MTRRLNNMLWSAVLISSSTLMGCASTGRIALPEDQRAAGAGAAVLALVPQNQINKDYEASNAGAAAAGAVAGIPGVGLLLAGLAGAAGGAVDAKVNAERAKEAEEQVQPLRVAMAEYNFDDKLKAALDQQLTAEALGMQPVTFSKDPAAKLDALSTATPQLNFSANYAVAQDFSSLSVRAFVQQMPRDNRVPPADGKKQTVRPPKPVYRNNFVYTVSLPKVEGQTYQERLEQWQQQGEGQVLAVRWLDSAVETLAQQFARDLGVSPASVKQQLADKSLSPYRLTPKGAVLGKILEQSGPLTVVRMRNGSLNMVVKL